jgi:hypothetical protein
MSFFVCQSYALSCAALKCPWAAIEYLLLQNDRHKFYFPWNLPKPSSQEPSNFTEPQGPIIGFMGVWLYPSSTGGISPSANQLPSPPNIDIDNMPGKTDRLLLHNFPLISFPKDLVDIDDPDSDWYDCACVSSIYSEVATVFLTLEISVTTLGSKIGHLCRPYAQGHLSFIVNALERRRTCRVGG